MKICIIPARGGSKRIPRKNIKQFYGKPMIAYSIDAALSSGCFDRVIVSTDDLEIADISRDFGAETPFIRPALISDDHTGTTLVVSHAIEWLQRDGAIPEQVCCLYATAPFVSHADIAEGQKLLDKTGCDYVFSVTSYAFPIQRAIRISEGSRVEMFQPENISVRSQDLEEAYHDAGQFYWGKAAAWLAAKPIFSMESLPLVLPRHRVQDIDTREDWDRAEIMFKLLQEADLN
ncbi:pseudaminic acid cytidylyltransferase [Pseudomonadales bacterium]|jgi:pseudaminic acid cytidylyltransferase|nr:pseudaminic acid cytidylyltransferase [Pseudomonadales bacterium]